MERSRRRLLRAKRSRSARKVFHEATPILVEAKPISRFSVSDPDRVRFGDLAFRSGLDLRSSAKEFGGFSSLWRSVNGREIIALADNAQWLRARVETSEGRLSGLADAVLTPLMLAGGKRLRSTRFYDTESFAIAGKTAFVGVERHHGVIRFAWDGRTFSGGAPIELPFDFSNLDRNGGLEIARGRPTGITACGSVAGRRRTIAGIRTPHARLYPDRFVPRRVRGGAIGWF